MKSKILFIASNVYNAVSFQWIVDKLNKEKFEIHFILMNDKKNSSIENNLKERVHLCFSKISYNGKKDFFKSALIIYRYIIREKIDIVHTHLFDASIAGLIAAKMAFVKKRIHTRHHSSLHHQYFPHAVKYDRLINYLSTDIISITNTVRTILIEKEKCFAKKIHLIHHGFDLKAFNEVTEERVNSLKLKYNIKPSSLVIGVISRYTMWKGVQNIIPAFKKILTDYPNAVLILANAKGDYEKNIKAQLNNILPIDSYREIVFEPDFMALYKFFNIFVHAPIDNHSEAFGQIYVEALASNIPSVFTLSGIANDFIKADYNALVVPHNSEIDIYKNINRLLKDEKLVQKITKNGIKSVQQFNLELFINKLEKLYSK